MGKKNTKTEFLEELHLGTGESRMTVRVLKKTTDSTWRGKDYHSVDVRAEIETGGFGHYSTFSVPITHPKIATYLSDMFGRVAEQMKTLPVDRHLRAHQLTDRRVEGIKDGLKSREVFTYEVVTGPYSTSSTYLGRDWLTRKGEFVRFELAGAEDANGGYGSGGDGGEPTWQPHEIGMTVRDVHAARQAADPSYETYWTDSEAENMAQGYYRYVLPGDSPHM